MSGLSRRVIARPIADLTPYSHNARTHSKKQIREIAGSIERFGFTNPVLVTDELQIIAGHGRVAAAKLLGWKEVPALSVSHLSPDEIRAYVLADNKLAENAGWDMEILAAELQGLIDANFDVELTGFTMAEVDIAIDTVTAVTNKGVPAAADLLPAASGPPVTLRGDLWQLGPHRLLCGDAREHADYVKLLNGEKAGMAFTDPPYNVSINGHVCGLGRVKHREFAMASGEMSKGDYTRFLGLALKNIARSCSDGAITFVFMDWRHIGELIQAGASAFDELKNVCVWNKTNAGMGTFYRSKHELVFVFKKGTAPHVNNFGLGDNGRYRTNVWEYPGVNSLGADRADALAMHPTVKPVALVADALRDCSKRCGIILDPFAGSGTTLIAAEVCGRRSRLIEYDPIFCDTIVRRFQEFAGQPALLDGTDQCFDKVAQTRSKSGNLA